MQLKKRIATVVAGAAIAGGLVVGAAATPAAAAGSWHYIGTYDNVRCSTEAQKYRKPQCRPFVPGASKLYAWW